MRCEPQSLFGALSETMSALQGLKARRTILGVKLGQGMDEVPLLEMLLVEDRQTRHSPEERSGDAAKGVEVTAIRDDGDHPDGQTSYQA